MRSKLLVTFPHASHPVLLAISRGLLGTAGILWVAMAASLCGCSPVNGWAMNQRGKSLYKEGQYQAARSEFERALMDRPYSADYAYNVAASMDQMGDHQAAEKMYRHALTLDPSHQPSYHGMAAMLVEEGRTDEATDLITTWSETQPYSSEAIVELGWLKGEMGDVDGANLAFQKALQENPRNTRALKQMARANRKAGLPGEAAANYARALYMDPDLPEARDELAELEQQIYSDPALQMAATMPLFDPTLQPAPYPAVVSPQLQQAQMAGARGYAPGYPTGYAPGYGSGLQPVPNEYPLAAGATGTYPPNSLGVNSRRGTNAPPTTPSPPQFIRTNWTQPQPGSPMPNGMTTYAPSTYPSGGPTPFGTAQQYNTARPSGSFFQSQQSFEGEMPGEMITSTPMQTHDHGFSPSVSYGEAPVWTSEPMSTTPATIPGTTTTVLPGLNGSFGTSTPAPQISSAPVVPAF